MLSSTTHLVFLTKLHPSNHKRNTFFVFREVLAFLTSIITAHPEKELILQLLNWLMYAYDYLLFTIAGCESSIPSVIVCGLYSRWGSRWGQRTSSVPWALIYVYCYPWQRKDNCVWVSCSLYITPCSLACLYSEPRQNPENPRHVNFPITSLLITLILVSVALTQQVGLTSELHRLPHPRPWLLGAAIGPTEEEKLQHKAQKRRSACWHQEAPRKEARRNRPRSASPSPFKFQSDKSFLQTGESVAQKASYNILPGPRPQGSMGRRKKGPLPPQCMPFLS